MWVKKGTDFSSDLSMLLNNGSNLTILQKRHPLCVCVTSVSKEYQYSMKVVVFIIVTFHFSPLYF